MSADLLQHHQDPSLYQGLAYLFNRAFQEGFPSSWNTITIRNLFKKGDARDPANYRGLAIMGVWPKIAAQLVLTRLTHIVER